MENAENIADKTIEKINELQKNSLKGNGSLMYVIRQNIKNWELNLKPVCKISGKGYVQTVGEILKSCGYDVKNAKLNSYINRARKGE